MCGIVGLINLDREPVDPGVVERMSATLVHRGPDGHGIEQPDPHVVLGHRRLSIIDVDGGRQPLSNEDGGIWITYNGEIFNYRELRAELIDRGHRFKTTTDTEVIVHLYEEEGPACVERLNGQFAFALWDGERLFCARDPMGIKPFYWYQDERRFAFSSEPRALLALPGFQAEVDLDGIRLYLRYRFIPAPASALKGVRKLRAAESMIVDGDGRTKTSRYWSLDRATLESLDDVDVARSELREQLTAAVERQMVADVNVGAFLSGGLDSSAIVALMAAGREEPIHTFSIGFAEPKYDERAFAREVAEKFGTHHAAEVFSPVAAREVVDDLLDHLDEPFGDTSILPTYAVARLAQRHVKVVLSGDGGDELFAGYGRYFRALQLLAIPPPLRSFRRLLRWSRGTPRDPSRWRYPDTAGIDRLYHQILVRTSDSELRKLSGPLLREHRNGDSADPIVDLMARVQGMPPLSRVLAIDLHSILADYHLVKVDRASMRTSLEVRVPFLDLRFTELAFRLSTALKLYGNQSKGLLREAMRDDLPASVLGRSKRGFGPPLSHWFAGALAAQARERLSGALVVEEGLLDQRAIDNVLRPVRGKIDGTMLWRILVLESWLRGIRERRFVPR